MTNALTLENVKSYASEKNLLKGLEKLGLDDYRAGDEYNEPCRFVIARTPDGRWTAIFMATEFFNRNKCGGYLGFASYHGFMSV